eukprot:1142857-Rhodomonas_salina.4
MTEQLPTPTSTCASTHRLWRTRAAFWTTAPVNSSAAGERSREQRLRSRWTCPDTSSKSAPGPTGRRERKDTKGGMSSHQTDSQHVVDQRSDDPDVARIVSAGLLARRHDVSVPGIGHGR